MKTSFSTAQWRAIRWYFEENKLLPRLSSFPYVSFENRETKEIGKLHVKAITDMYEQKEKVNA